MTLPLTLEQTAAELGRSEGWLQKNWSRLVCEEGFPLPILDARPYVWDPVHVQAWKDRRLGEDLRRRVGELRGTTPDLVTEQNARVEEQRAELKRRFGVK